jgi:hypothetical protein
MNRDSVRPAYRMCRTEQLDSAPIGVRTLTNRGATSLECRSVPGYMQVYAISGPSETTPDDAKYRRRHTELWRWHITVFVEVRRIQNELTIISQVYAVQVRYCGHSSARAAFRLGEHDRRM